MLSFYVPGNRVSGTSSFWPVCLSITFFVCGKNLLPWSYLWTITYRAFIYHMCIPCDKTFLSVHIFDLVTLTVTFDVHFENFNLVHYFWTVIDMAFIFHMCIPCDNTFPAVPKILTLWPWPWPLTYILKSLTLIITFEP